MYPAPVFTDLHRRASGANQICRSIEGTKALLRRGHIASISFPLRLESRTARAPLSGLSALSILVSGLFGEWASGKDRTQNYCEQDYPASGRHDREDQAASPRH